MILIPQLPGASLNILLYLMSFVHIGAFGALRYWIDCAPATSFLTIDLTLSLLGRFHVRDKPTPRHMSTLPFSRPRTLSAPVFIVTRAPGSSGRSRGTRAYAYCLGCLPGASELPTPVPAAVPVPFIIPNRTNIGKR